MHMHMVFTCVLLLYSTLIQKQKRQRIHSLERIGLEKITLLTLQLICGIIFKQIAKVPRGSLSPEDFKQYSVNIISKIFVPLDNTLK